MYTKPHWGSAYISCSKGDPLETLGGFAIRVARRFGDVLGLALRAHQESRGSFRPFAGSVAITVDGRA